MGDVLNANNGEIKPVSETGNDRWRIERQLPLLSALYLLFFWCFEENTDLNLDIGVGVTNYLNIEVPFLFWIILIFKGLYYKIMFFVQRSYLFTSFRIFTDLIRNWSQFVVKNFLSSEPQKELLENCTEYVRLYLLVRYHL